MRRPRQFLIGSPLGPARLGERAAQHPLLDTVARRDVDRGVTDRWTRPATLLREEHLFVRAPRGQANQVFVVGTALGFERGRTALRVFDAERLA